MFTKSNKDSVNISNKRFSAKTITAFVIVFAALGSFLLFSSFASTPTIATLQAENMTLPAGSTVVTDNSASGGKAVMMSSHGYLSGQVNLPSNSTSLSVMAKAGSTCHQTAGIRVLLDNSVVIKDTTVKGTNYTSINSTALNTPAGTHNLKIYLSNPNIQCNHILYVDVTNFYGPTPPPPPAPTVALSANPTSLTAGQSSTLTWTSTNTSSCTASGAWSGSEPTSGSTTTGALNTNSTYTLTCLGPGGTATQTANITVASSGGGGTGANCLKLQSDGVHPIYASLDSCGYPSPSTTGVPAATTLTTVSTNCGCLPHNTSWNGNQLAITGPTTISGLNIPGTIYFVTSDFSDPANASVVIENSRVQAANVNSVIDLQGAGNVTIKNTQVSGIYSGASCTGPASEDIFNGGANVVLDHDYLSCAGEPLNGSRWTLTNSYIIIDGYPTGSHNEDIYIAPKGGGDYENNTLLNPNNQTASIFGNAKLGALSNLTIKNNLISMNGDNGDVAIGCYGSGVPNEGYGYSTNVSVTGNRMSSIYDSSASPFVSGNTDGGSGTTWSGNYMDNNLSVIISQPINPC